jgi:ATP-dependent Clp protease protease subunit
MDKLDMVIPKGFYTRPVSNLASFYLYDVESPDKYTDWFETIRHASEHDIIKIHVNSIGGNLNTALQLMRCIDESQATVICSVEGECMSAATMVIMRADMVEISKHSVFMFHNYSGGTIGKGGEMYEKITFEKPWIEGIMRDVYDDFLSEDEIDKILDGKDIWMNGDEVMERLEKRAEKLKEKNEDVEDSGLLVDDIIEKEPSEPLF